MIQISFTVLISTQPVPQFLWKRLAMSFHFGDLGWRSCESTCLRPIWPGFDFLTRCDMWTEFVGSVLCSERFFPLVLWFSPLTKKPTYDLICCDSV